MRQSIMALDVDETTRGKEAANGREQSSPDPGQGGRGGNNIKCGAVSWYDAGPPARALRAMEPACLPARLLPLRP